MPRVQRVKLEGRGVNSILEVRGRARREAARRRNSERKVNLFIRNSSRSNGSWQMTPKTVSFFIIEPHGIWTCVSLQCTNTSGGLFTSTLTFSRCDGG